MYSKFRTCKPHSSKIVFKIQLLLSLYFVVKYVWVHTKKKTLNNLCTYLPHIHCDFLAPIWRQWYGVALEPDRLCQTSVRCPSMWCQHLKHDQYKFVKITLILVSIWLVIQIQRNRYIFRLKKWKKLENLCGKTNRILNYCLIYVFIFELV